jgi:tetratricopeptide (TPR) repeat protein
MLESAAALLAPSEVRQRAHTLASLGRAYALTNDRGSAERARTAAIAFARGLGDERTLAVTLGMHLAALFPWSRPAGKLEIAEELYPLIDREDADGYLLGLTMVSAAYFLNARMADFERVAREGIQAAEEMRRPLWIYTLRGNELALRFIEGDLVAAERIVEELFELGQTVDWIDASGVYGLRMFLIRREQGRLSEVEAPLRTLLELMPDATVWQLGLLSLHTELGDLDAARALFEHLAEVDFARVPRDGAWVTNLCFLADACARLGAAAQAPALLGHLRPFAEWNIVAPGLGVPLGAAARYQGMLAATAEFWDAAEDAFQRGLAVEGPTGSPLLRAHTLFEYSRMFARRGSADDAEQAAARRAEANAQCATHGLAGLAQRIARGQ